MDQEDVKESDYISEEEEANFVRKLQLGTGRFKGKQFEKRKSYYANEVSSEDEEDSDQELEVLMAKKDRKSVV